MSLNGSVLRASVSIVIATIEQYLKIFRRHGAVVEETLGVAAVSLFTASDSSV